MRYKFGDIVYWDNGRCVVIRGISRKDANYYVVVKEEHEHVYEEQRWSNVKPRKGIEYFVKREDKLEQHKR